MKQNAQKNRRLRRLIIAAVAVGIALVVTIGVNVLITKPWEKSPPFNRTDRADIDLTAMSSTMVFAYVEDMVARPQAYSGKTVKARGKYDNWQDTIADKYYHFVVIEDALACCGQGLEFVYDGFVDAEDFPEKEEIIVIEGTYEVFEELGSTYYRIIVHSLTV